MCTARDSNSLAALSAIVAFVLLLFEEPALLTATIASKRQLRDYPSEPFFASKVPTHDLPLYLLAAFFRWLMLRRTVFAIETVPVFSHTIETLINIMKLLQ